MEPLRRRLGAELAATRPVTDAGWLPHGRQVGVTARSIAPDLYLALGVGDWRVVSAALAAELDRRGLTLLDV